MTTDGAIVDDNCLHDDGDSGDKDGMQDDRDDKTDGCDDDNIGGAGNDRVGGQMCEFRRGWCISHKIKGDKTQRKVKKWAKKTFGCGWGTSTLIEYTFHLGNSDNSALSAQYCPEWSLTSTNSANQ